MIFLVEFYGRIFCEDFLGGLLGGFFGRNSLFTLELICLSKFWFFVKILSKSKEGRKEEFRSLEVHLKIRIFLGNKFKLHKLKVCKKK